MYAIRSKTTVADGCMYRTWHYTDEGSARTHRQVKRRRAGVTPSECTWSYGYCPDHPSKVIQKVGA